MRFSRRTMASKIWPWSASAAGAFRWRSGWRRTSNASQKRRVPLGTLNIPLYRDDLSTLDTKPVVQKSEMEIPITGKSVVLVDDVLYTGRTTRAAMDALFRSGRPKRLQLCVLIDRGHRELPIEAAFIGRTVQTTENEIIEVKLREVDDAEKVLLMEKQ